MFMLGGDEVVGIGAISIDEALETVVGLWTVTLIAPALGCLL